VNAGQSCSLQGEGNSRKESTIMSLANWIGVITALLSPIPAAIAGAIIIKVLERVMQPKRQVIYEVTSSNRVLLKEVESQIRATFNGQPISNAQLISLRMKNTGKDPILPEEYAQGTKIRFSFGNDAKALAVEQTSVPDQTSAPVTSVTIDAEGRVSLDPLRLQSKESVTLDILVNDFRDEIIVGTPLFDRRPFPEQKVMGVKVPLSSKSPHPRNIFFTLIILVFMAFLLLFVTNISIYEIFYNENFSVSLSNIFYFSVFIASFMVSIMIGITHIVSNYFSPLEVGTGHPDTRQTILRMNKPGQRFPLINYVWTIFAFLIIAPLIYLLVVAALEISIGTLIYAAAYPNSYFTAFINSALLSGLIITFITSIFTRFVMNEHVHKRFPLKMPAIIPKISRNFRSPLPIP
jgi:hypothetical protein